MSFLFKKEVHFLPSFLLQITDDMLPGSFSRLDAGQLNRPPDISFVMLHLSVAHTVFFTSGKHIQPSLNGFIYLSDKPPGFITMNIEATHPYNPCAPLIFPHLDDRNYRPGYSLEVPSRFRRALECVFSPRRSGDIRMFMAVSGRRTGGGRRP